MKASLRFMVVVIVLLAIAVPSGKAVTGRGERMAGDPPRMIVWEPADPAVWTADGRSQVESIIERMQAMIHKIPPEGSLTNEIVAAVAALYGPNGNLTGDDGMTYRGGREIAMYFHQLMACRKVSDLKIEIKFVYAKEFTERAKKMSGPNDIVHSLYFILSCSYRLDGQLIDPPSSTNCPHTRVCECSTGK